MQERANRKKKRYVASASPCLQSNSCIGSTVANATSPQTKSEVVPVKRVSQRLATKATDTQQLKEISSWSGSVLGCFPESIFPACLEQLKGNGGIPKSIRNLFVVLVSSLVVYGFGGLPKLLKSDWVMKCLKYHFPTDPSDTKLARREVNMSIKETFLPHDLNKPVVVGLQPPLSSSFLAEALVNIPVKEMASVSQNLDDTGENSGRTIISLSDAVDRELLGEKAVKALKKALETCLITNSSLKLRQELMWLMHRQRIKSQQQKWQQDAHTDMPPFFYNLIHFFCLDQFQCGALNLFCTLDSNSSFVAYNSLAQWTTGVPQNVTCQGEIVSYGIGQVAFVSCRQVHAGLNHHLEQNSVIMAQLLSDRTEFLYRALAKAMAFLRACNSKEDGALEEYQSTDSHYIDQTFYDSKNYPSMK